MHLSRGCADASFQSCAIVVLNRFRAPQGRPCRRMGEQDRHTLSPAIPVSENALRKNNRIARLMRLVGKLTTRRRGMAGLGRNTLAGRMEKWRVAALIRGTSETETEIRCARYLPAAAWLPACVALRRKASRDAGAPSSLQGGPESLQSFACNPRSRKCTSRAASACFRQMRNLTTRRRGMAGLERNTLACGAEESADIEANIRCAGFRPAWRRSGRAAKLRVDVHPHTGRLCARAGCARTAHACRRRRTCRLSRSTSAAHV